MRLRSAERYRLPCTREPPGPGGETANLSGARGHPRPDLESSPATLVSAPAATLYEKDTP